MSDLFIERADRIAVVRMNRPERRNALSIDFMRALTRTAESLRDDSSIDVVLLGGARNWFSAGADLKDDARWSIGTKSLREQREIDQTGYRMAQAWEQLPQISIAAIEGYAVGGGLALALACDWRVMGRDAFVSLPEIGLGLPLTWGTLPRLIALVGPARAKRLTILCERIGAGDALNMGLVDYVVAQGQTEDEARSVARRVLEMPQASVRMSKETINATAYALAHLASHAGADQFSLAAASEEAAAARARFRTAGCAEVNPCTGGSDG
ncbi:MAG TPA: enoyl-CoA hydratase/isomerase family protein [Burkholderiales bacterium]|nr:enoyl-CoA hydratase/isomerase family protein [Burkholderiales bacterium]